MKAQNAKIAILYSPSIGIRYKEAADELARIKDKVAELKAQIMGMMDDRKTDVIDFGDAVASRKLIAQERLDSKKAKELLGELAPIMEVEQIKFEVK